MPSVTLAVFPQRMSPRECQTNTTLFSQAGGPTVQESRCVLAKGHHATCQRWAAVTVSNTSLRPLSCTTMYGTSLWRRFHAASILPRPPDHHHHIARTPTRPQAHNSQPSSVLVATQPFHSPQAHPCPLTPSGPCPAPAESPCHPSTRSPYHLESIEKGITQLPAPPCPPHASSTALGHCMPLSRSASCW